MITIETKCTRCGCGIQLKQHPECPPLQVDVWLRIVVCNRCGKYCERFRAIDDAVAKICVRWQMVSSMRESESARVVIAESLGKLMMGFNRLLTEHWRTEWTYSAEIVDVLMESPDKSRIALRFEETQHRKARETADREATKQGRLLGMGTE